MIEAELMRRVPGCENDTPPLELRELPGGRGVNRVLLVATRAGRFVLRRKLAPLERPGADPLQEIAVHRVAAAAGIAPPLVDCAADGSWLLMEHVDGVFWQPADLTRDSAVEVLGQQLGRLHRLEPPAAIQPFDPLHLVALHRQVIADRSPEQQRTAAALESQAVRACHELAGFGTRVVINHGDLQLSNVLGPRAILIDWEYAQLADPAWDIACLLTYYPPLEARLGALLRAAGLDPAGDRERLDLQRQLFGALDGLWALANGVQAG